MKKIFLAVIFIFLIYIPVSFAEFPIPYSEDLDITNQNINIKLENNSVKVGFITPVKAFHPFKISLIFKNNNIEKITSSSNMAMSMGVFDKNLTKVSNNEFQLTQTLVKCKSGNTKWFTKFNVYYTSGKKMDSFIIFYDVK